MFRSAMPEGPCNSAVDIIFDAGLLSEPGLWCKIKPECISRVI